MQHQVGGSAPLGRGQALPLPPEIRLAQGPEVRGMGGILRDLLVRRAALQLGGRHLGGQGRLPLVGVDERQQLRVKEGGLPCLLRRRLGPSGPFPVVLTVM